MTRFLLAALLLASPAAAEPFCLPPAEMRAFLFREFQETLVSGDINNEPLALVEIYASPAGTWTLTTRDIPGPACMLMAGTDLVTLEVQE